MYCILNNIYIFDNINIKTMDDFVTIQLKLDKEFNYDLDVYIARLRRDNQIQDAKTKAQIIIELARQQLLTKRTSHEV